MDLDNASFEKIVENLNEGLYFVDSNRKITYWNKAAERISGFSAAEVVGRSCADNILTHVDGDGHRLCTHGCPLLKSITDTAPRETEIYMHHKNGQRIPVSVRTSALINAEGKIVGGIELFTDISQQKANQLRIKDLEKMAMLDNLTQLANRNYIERELHSRFEEKKRFNVPFGILLMDIDHFKRFNDTYGHDVGDKVLKFVADTFVNNARPFDLFGRWGGEEFVGILRNIATQDIAKVGNRMRILVENSYLSEGDKKLQVTISMGVTMVEDSDTVETIFKRADKLLYKSKAAGRNRITVG